MSKMNVINALKYWNLESESVEHIYTSVHNSSWKIGDKYVLQQQLKPNAERLSGKIHLANLLAKESIPTVKYIKTTSGEWTSPDGAYSLMEKLKGEHIDFYESPEMMHELGCGLAQLHLVLSKVESELQFSDYDFLAEWNSYTKSGLVGVSDEILERVEEKILEIYWNLPRSPIHRDVHSENVLFEDEKISGWLDFDLNRKDARIFDIAYILAGLLVGRINDPAMLEIWGIIRNNLLDGYNEVSQLTTEEIEVLPFLLIVIELLFVTYFNNMDNPTGRDDAHALAMWLWDSVKC